MAKPIPDRFNPASLYKMAQVEASQDGASAHGNGTSGGGNPGNKNDNKKDSKNDNKKDGATNSGVPGDSSACDAFPGEGDKPDESIVTESGESVPDQFTVKLPISRFTRLWELVGDYRLAENQDTDPDVVQKQLQEQQQVSNDADSGYFEAKFRLSKFADSSFVADMVAAAGSESNPGRSATSLPADTTTERAPARERKNASSKPSDKRQSSKHAPKGGSLSSVARGVRGDANERAATTPIIVASGEMTAQLSLQCQRCLDSYEERIETEFKFAFAANEITADVLPETMDPVMLDEEGMISVVDMFEDELLLRLPTHAMHADESQCSDKAVPYQAHVVTKEQLDAEIKPENPFAVLKNIDLPKNNK